MIAPEIPAAAKPITDFASVLRQNGFVIAPSQTIEVLEATTLLGPRSIQDIHRAGRAVFAIPRERWPEYDAHFRAHFLGEAIHAPAEGDDGDEVEARETTGTLETEEAETEDTPGDSATAAERLGHRALTPGTEARDFARHASTLPRRRTPRRAPAPKGDRPDRRRTLRVAARTGGDLATIKTTREKTRQRRILLLIDVSGSMAERSEGTLRFAHTLVRHAERAEVFTLGTRLTRITPDLRPRDPARAMEAVSAAVADIDGGTRIGAALEAFLAVPRYAGLARGAAITVVSDGLERGDPLPLVQATRRLARLAWRLDWLTPLAADQDYRPETQALGLILPELDSLKPGDSADAIARHLLSLS